MPHYVELQRMAAARAAGLARQHELLKKAQAGAVKLDTADRAYARGEVFLAARLYASLARSQPKAPMGKTARLRLERLAGEARGKLAEIDAKLEDAVLEMAASDWANKDRWPAGLREKLAAAFGQYEAIVDNYGGILSVRRELESHIARQRRRPDYAAVLNEPEAETLLELAGRHEAEDQQCCAYWVYGQAAKLAPAPSARLAAERLEDMQRKPEVLAAAERCRELQWCHRRYAVAEQLARSKPEKAIGYFEEIVERSPADSEIHRAALVRLAEIALK